MEKKLEKVKLIGLVDKDSKNNIFNVAFNEKNIWPENSKISFESNWFFLKIIKLGKNRNPELEKMIFGIAKNKEKFENYDLIKGNLKTDTKIISLIDAKAKIRNHFKNTTRKDNR